MLAHIFSGALGFQSTEPLQWIAVLAAFGLLAAQVMLLTRAGGRDGSRAARLGRGLTRATGLPSWAAAGFVFGLWALTTAFIGFMWDVAWHTDLGRDRLLFTVPHTLILVGLIGIGVAALVSIFYASRDGAPGSWQLRRLVVPPGAAVMLALSAAAGIAFPLDDLWHATYGIDVTMWSLTHLLMIGGASLTPMAIALLVWHGGRPRRSISTLVLGTMLIGLSTLQLEFDMGVPQWQALYHPLLLALAAGFALTAARALLGRWGALQTALLFVVMRGLIALLIGPVLGHTLPHFPLYLVEALCVEVAFAATASALRRALLAGLLIGTAGMAAEWGWTQAWGIQPWQPGMLPSMWLPLVAAVAAALCGAGFAASLGAVDPGRGRAPARLAAGALAALLVLIAVPLPRAGVADTAHITTWPLTRAVSTVDRNGQRVTTRDVAVRVQLDNPGAAAGADWFRVVAWQGGGVVNVPLLPAGDGVYVAARPVPVGGNWKAIVLLARGQVLAAAPVSMPAEPDQRLPAIPLKAERSAPLDSAQALLLRENHNGAAWVADVAYGMFLLTVVVWLSLLCAGATRLRRHMGVSAPGTPRPPRASRLHLGLRFRHTPAR